MRWITTSSIWLSPAKSVEESGWVLRVEGGGGYLSDWWKRAGACAVSVWLPKNAVIWTREFAVKANY